jgi:hypothetical protein
MPQPSARRVALIGWDAADWKIIHPLLDAGLMPNLRKLVERGAMGNIATLDPPMSPLLWTSIATGKTADLHGIHGFAEPDPATGGVRPITSTSRTAKALWNILSQSGLRSLVVNWFASHPAEPIEGAIVSNAFAITGGPAGSSAPLPAGTIHPASLASALSELRVLPADLTGDDLLPFIPALAEIDQKADRRPLALAAILAQNISVQGAAIWLMEREPWDFLAVYFDMLDHAGHAFMAYRAPRMENVTEKDFELYRNVVNGAYCFQDAMLGRMVALAGPDTVFMVVSDHGFHSDHLRGGAAITVNHETPMEWHRSHGIVCVAGPGVRRDELFYGATLLDVAPTILALFGLPAAQDMQGRVLAEAFERPTPLDRIPSWEDVPGASGMHTPESSLSAWDSAAVMEQMVALGYLEPLAPEAKEQRRMVRVHQAFSLARVHLGRGNPAAALPLMEEAAREYPEEITYQVYLAQCYYETGRMNDCRRVVRAVLDRGGDRPAARVLEANLCLAEGRIEEGLAGLLAAEQSGKPAQGIRYAIGQVYLNLKRWKDAERAFRSLIVLDEDFAAAHTGLAQALLAQRKFEPAAESAADALALRFDLPDAHLTLGAALVRLGENERAAQAFETCLALRPDSAAARQELAKLHPAVSIGSPG